MSQPSKQGLLVHTRLNIALSFIDDLDRFGVAGFSGISPCDKSVLFHEHQLCLWIVQNTLGNHFGECKSRANIRYPDESIPEDFFGNFFTVIRTA
ncbi:hypothetical protein D3C77_377720 [compost metagenome]